MSAESAGAIALGPDGDPGEYADAVAFLAGARASYITGSVVRLDGGPIASIKSCGIRTATTEETAWP